ncbi:hypothetical protein [Ensifer adhaerens]
MQFHGHRLKVLSRNNAPVPQSQWQDTVLMAPMDAVEVAFITDKSRRLNTALICHGTVASTASSSHGLFTSPIPVPSSVPARARTFGSTPPGALYRPLGRRQ